VNVRRRIQPMVYVLETGASGQTAYPSYRSLPTWFLAFMALEGEITGMFHALMREIDR